MESISRIVKPPYYRKIFTLNQPITLDYCFDFIDVDPLFTDPTLDLNKVYITISGDSYKWRLSDLVGSYVKACGISISFENSEKGKTLGLILGGEYQQYQRTRTYSVITQEAIGLIQNLQTIDSDVKALDSDVKALKTWLTGIEKADLFNVSVSANTDILSSPIKASNPPSIFRIYAVFDTAGVLFVKRIRGSTSVLEALNNGASLNANASYIFDIIVSSLDSINFQYSVDATLLTLIVVEVSALVS
jgi:hypothetical protein